MRKLFRFSLFKAFILFTIAGVGLALFGQRHYRAMAQKEAVAALQTAPEQPKSQVIRSGILINNIPDYRQASIVYDYQLEEYSDIGSFRFLRGIKGLPGGKPPKSVPHRWSKWLGVDFMHNVVMVDFNYPMTGEEIVHLKKLRDLKTVSFSRIDRETGWDELVNCKQIRELKIKSYAGIRSKIPSLENLNRLTEIDIDSGIVMPDDLISISMASSLTRIRLKTLYVRSSSLERMAELPNLESFYALIDAKMNKTGDCEFEFLDKMPNVKKVVLHGDFPINQKMFERLSQLTSLEKLAIRTQSPAFLRFKFIQPLAASREKDMAQPLAVLKPLSGLPNLKHLELEFHQLSDADMEFVARLSKLEYLSISHTGVGNRGIEWLEQLANLKTLKLGVTKITRSGLEGFKEKNPTCKIEWN